MKPKPKNGKRKHGKYCKYIITHPKISEKLYEEQLLRAYNNMPLEVPLAALSNQYPKFQCDFKKICDKLTDNF